MRYGKTGTFVVEPLSNAAAVKCHDRLSLGHCLDADQAKRFRPHRTECDHLGPGVRLSQLVSNQPPFHFYVDTGVHSAAHHLVLKITLAQRAILADDEQFRSRLCKCQTVDQFEKPLLWRQATHVQDDIFFNDISRPVVQSGEIRKNGNLFLLESIRGEHSLYV